MMTPWGMSQHQYTITTGVHEVDTAGHGGILVGGNIAHTLLSPQALALGWRTQGWYAYEEDCDWAIFAYEQPALFGAARRKQGMTHSDEQITQFARESLLLWHPDYLALKEGRHKVMTPHG